MAREPLPAPQAGNGRPCPICGRPEDVVLTPFCSKRCADVDLHRWLKGTYVVPGDEPAGDDLEGDE